MIDANFVRDFFQVRHAAIVRYLERRLRPLYDDVLDELVQDAECLALENMISCADAGKIGNLDTFTHYFRSSIRWAVVHARSGRSVHDKGRKENAVFGDVWHKMDRRDETDEGFAYDFVSHETDPADAAAFKIDFESLLSRLDSRRRSIFLDLMIGTPTGEVAAKYGISPGRVSQFRKTFFDMIQMFFAD